jgi:hypothetical protein
MVRMIFHHIVIASLGAALGPRLDVKVGHLVLLVVRKTNNLSGLRPFLPYVGYDGFLAGGVNCPLAMSADGPASGGHVVNLAARGIGLVLTHDLEALLAASFPRK